MQNFMTIPKMSLVRSLEVKFSSYGSNKVIKGVKMEIILIQYRICTICISVDWKFPSEFKYVHLEVIRGHLRGQKGHFEVKSGRLVEIYTKYIYLTWNIVENTNLSLIKVNLGQKNHQRSNVGNNDLIRVKWGRYSFISTLRFK